MDVGMALIDGLREELTTTDEPTSYRCVDCLSEYDEPKQLCPKCGSAEFDRTRD